MFAPARLRQSLKWSCAIIAALLTALWLISLRYGFLTMYPSGRGFGIAVGAVQWCEFTGSFRAIGITQYRQDQSLASILNCCFTFRRQTTSTVSYCLPLWIPAALAACGALWTRHAQLRATRNGKNRCHVCDYSRTGLAPNAPCPECGTPPVTPSPSS